MLKIQEYISCFDKVVEAIPYLGANLKISTEPVKVNEAYSMYLFKPGPSADMSNPLVREANCLILDSHNELIAKSWDHPLEAKGADKFPEDFNFGHNTTFDELPDGKLVVVYNIDGEWFLTTQEDPFAREYIVDLPAFTYENEIKTLLATRHGTWDKLFKTISPDLCFSLMYVDPYASNVMPYISKELYLLGVTNLVDGKQMNMNYCDNAANRLDLARPHRGTVCGFNSLGARLRMMRALAPGLMLADSDGERCLISNPIYRAVRNAKAAGDRVRPTHMAKILQSFRDKADLVSVCAAYEDFMPMLDLLWSVRVELWQELTMLWNEARDKDLREFAGMVQHHPLNFLLFMLKNREIDGLKDAVENIKPIKLIGCAKHKWEKEFVQAENILKIGGNTHAVEENDREEEGGIPYCQEGD